MADQEIINVLLRLENPQVLDRVERLKSEQFQIKFSGSLDQGIKDILAIKDKKISIVADVQGAINSLKQVETSLKSLQGLQEIKINLSGNIEKDLDRIGKKALELQAKLYAAELNQLGLVQNYNPKTFSGGDKEIRQAQVLRGINEQTVVANRRAPITQQQIDAARTNQPVRELVNETTAPYNPGQIRRTQQVGELPDEKAVTRAIQARQEDILKAAEKQVIADFNSIANDLIKDISKPASGASSVVGGGTSDKLRLGKLAEDAALERQARESNAAREIANNALNEQRIRQNFLSETGVNQGVRVPLSQVGAVTRADSQNDFERAQELASAQIREERLAKLRENLPQDELDFHRTISQGTAAAGIRLTQAEADKEKQRQEERLDFLREVQPGVRSVNKKFDTEKERNQAAKVAQLQKLGKSAALGALQGQGLLSVGGSVLGSVLGAGVPGGAAFGGLAGGAIGASVEKSLEIFTRSLERAAEAGLSFETSILGISSVLQATTNVTGSNGQQLSVGDQLSFQQGQARSIQKLARTKLLPLGISGDKESTLVQSIISGAAQRGIQLSPEQAATLAERLGGAIQSQRPELLGNSGQLRRDVEDLFSGAPQNTVLKTLTKGFAPGLGKATSAEDLIKRSEGLASFPETLRGSTTNPVVAAQKFNSAIDNLNTTFGDAIVIGLIPGINALTKTLANPNLLLGVESFGAAVGQVGTIIAGTTTALVSSLNSVGRAAKGAGAIGTLLLGDQDDKVGRLRARKDLGLFTDEKKIDAQIEAAQKEAEEKRKSRFKVSPTADVQIKALLEGSGLLDSATAASADQKGGLAGLAVLNNQKDLISVRSKEAIAKATAQAKTLGKSGIDEDTRKGLESEEFTDRLANSLQRVERLRKGSTEISSVLDSSSKLGELNKLQVGSTFASKIRDEAENTLSLARVKRNELGSDAKQEDVNKADTVVRDATLALIKARNDERDAINQVKDAELSRTKALKDSQFDPGTVQGRAGLIKSGLSDAEARISKSAVEIKDFKSQLDDPALNPLDRANLQSRLEKSTLEFNQGQIGRAQLSREAQNNAIDLAQGPEEVKKALQDFANSAQDAADKFTSLSNQLEKSEEALKDFQDSKKLRELGREGTIIDAAEKALKANEGDIIGINQIESQIPPELANLVKGNFSFNSLARERFDRSKTGEEFADVLRRNTPERFAANEVRTEGGLFRDIDKTKRDLAVLPGEDITRKFSNLRQLVGLQQQGVDVGTEGKEFIAKQAKELGINLPDLKNAETLSADVPANVASIDETVKQILSVLGGSGTTPTGATDGKASAPKLKDALFQAAAGKSEEEVTKKKSRLDLLKEGLGFAAGAVVTGATRAAFPFADSVDLGSVFGDSEEETTKKVTSGINDNPINFSDSLIARPSLPSRAYNPILREGLNEGLGNKSDAKTNAVLEDVVGGFLDADVDGLKKQNRAPASGLKNGLFSGGLFGDLEGVKSGAGTDLSKFADAVTGAINAASDKVTDQISKALGSAL